MNLCPICTNQHDKGHIIIDYDKKNYKCNLHNESYISYCNKCKKNICLLCENEHMEHEVLSYKNIIQNKNDVKSKLNILRKTIDLLSNNIKNIIDILNSVIENMEIYYKINSDFLDNYDEKNRNYQILMNLNEINSNDIINDLNQIINDYNINI